jgi:hypothetical protein
VLLAVSGSLLPGVSRSSEPAERSVVDAAIAASKPEADALVEAIEDVAGRLGLRVRIERRDDRPPSSVWPDDVVAGVWIDARAPDRIDIRMTSVRPGSAPRSFERSLAREGSNAVVVEEVAEVVYAALDSIRASAPEPPRAIESAPETRAPAAPDASEGAVHAVSPRVRGQGFGLDAIAFGSERAMSARSGPVLGVGAGADVSFGRVPWRPSVWLSAAYGTRFDVQSGPVTFDVAASSFRLMPAVAILELDVMQMDLGVGGGVDLFRVAPLVVRNTQAAFGQPTTFADPVATGQLLVRLRLVSQVRMTFGFDVDYDCAPHEVSVPGGRPGRPPDTFEPWGLRPSLALGLCVPLSSGGACTSPR